MLPCWRAQRASGVCSFIYYPSIPDYRGCGRCSRYFGLVRPVSRCASPLGYINTLGSCVCLLSSRSFPLDKYVVAATPSVAVRWQQPVKATVHLVSYTNPTSGAVQGRLMKVVACYRSHLRHGWKPAMACRLARLDQGSQDPPWSAGGCQPPTTHSTTPGF